MKNNTFGLETWIIRTWNKKDQETLVELQEKKEINRQERNRDKIL